MTVHKHAMVEEINMYCSVINIKLLGGEKMESIYEVRGNIDYLKRKVDDKVKEAKDELDKDNIDKAEELEKEIEMLRQLIKEKEEELQQMEMSGRGVRKSPNLNELGVSLDGEKSQYTKDFEHYLQTKELRSGNIVTDSGFVVIPPEIVTEIQNIVEDELKLADYVSVRNVEFGSGKVPLLKQEIQPLPEVKELQENPALSVTPYQEVEYEIKTHRGFLLVSREALEDEKSDLVRLLKDYFARAILSTENKAILEAIKELEEIEAIGFDGIKDVLNTKVLPNYANNTILLNQSAYNEIDKLKDNNGRYLLQESIQDPTVRHINGARVVIVPNSLLPSNEDGTHPIIVGNLKDAVVLFRRSQYEARWEDYMHFGDGYMIAVRQDATAFNKSSAFVLKFKTE